MPGAATISFSCVDSSLSSLRNCQSYIDTGMDIATRVALDLVESFNDVEEVDSMENVMLEYAAMDRELNHYMTAIEETVHQASALGKICVVKMSRMLYLEIVYGIGCFCTAQILILESDLPCLSYNCTSQFRDTVAGL
ncbi:E3 SUMO-protein ligase NSE2 isoform X2 [Nothoprocta perdicaria]|uniref:E3 SUMO-protein ligase NSE2 isoform X2 n=1 Tax=Nothoprocta perdicaria TaxID=30464 RepID=UPI000E1BBB75|nr:E3 SUMO-protein ligase NSE2 isoform X2 [Nothoprocta perdicaria]